MNTKKKRVGIKRHKDRVTISVTVPEEIYLHIKQCAKNEIRNVNQQARLFLEIGIEVMQQQNEQCQQEGEEVHEKESCIGFHVERIDEDYEDE